MQFTWSDYGDEKYFHILILKQQRSGFALNPITMFEKFSTMIQRKLLKVSNQDFSKYVDKFVKVIVVNKDKSTWFDAMLDKLHKADPIAYVSSKMIINIWTVSDEEMEGVKIH